MEHTPAVQEQWNAARIAQPLYTGERLRTREASRASVLFVDETQIKLNANAMLTVQNIRQAGGGPTELQLGAGEAWFRTKNPRSGVTIRTPTAAAAIRGTEINFRVGPSGESVLTVIEGAAELSNTAGAILVLAGEEGTAIPGEPPSKRLVLTPDDAVQWVLYYPSHVAWRDLPPATSTGPSAPGFELLRRGDRLAAIQTFEPVLEVDPWARIGTSIAALALGELNRARDVLEAPATGDAEWDRRVQLAATRLASGDAAGARAELDAVLAANPTALRALVAVSSLELRQNRNDRALAAAERAVAAHPDSVGALVAAAEAEQSRFDLVAARRYLDRALTLDPDEVRALVNRARIRFGADDLTGARVDADHAARVSGGDAQVQSLRGFIHLSEGRTQEARADFESAVRRDSESGEPHLGLGLLEFREGREQEGLFELLTATLLEPKVSLYQSYLGKAYYQARRFPEGLAALETAKRLDPRDPTPWLYASFFLRDQHRQVDALNELRRAIALNGFRAVYRSRLLLDQDLATKNVSLAEVYRQLGFEAWGAFEALRSLEADVTNASAHLFLGQTYGNLPDRLQALSGELLQYFLYAPVNRNAFNTFSEYTALLEQPRRQLDATGGTGTERLGDGSLAFRTGNNRVAHVSFIEAQRRDGTRPEADERVQAFAQGKVALGRRTDVFVAATGVSVRRGADEVVTQSLGSRTAPVIVRRFTPRLSPYETNRESNVEGVAGFRHGWRPGWALTGTARVVRTEVDQLVDAPWALCAIFGLPEDECPIRVITRLTLPIDSTEMQVQQVSRFGRHQIITGVSTLRQAEELRQYSATTVDGILDFEFELLTPARDSASSFFVRDEVPVTSWLHASVGLRYQRFDYIDRRIEDVVRFRDWNPQVGVTIRAGSSTVVRAAAFRHRNVSIVRAGIAPTTIAGFPIERNELPTTLRQEVGVAFERDWSRAFIGVQASIRDLDAPPFQRGVLAIPEANSQMRDAVVHANWIASRRLSVFAAQQYSRFEAPAFDRRDLAIRAGVNYLDPRGLRTRLSVARVEQRFGRVDPEALPPSRFTIVDAQASYEFAGKRGLASLVVTNLFDATFTAAVEALSIEQWLPRRRVIASLGWRIW